MLQHYYWLGELSCTVLSLLKALGKLFCNTNNNKSFPVFRGHSPAGSDGVNLPENKWQQCTWGYFQKNSAPGIPYTGLHWLGRGTSSQLGGYGHITSVRRWRQGSRQKDLREAIYFHLLPSLSTWMTVSASGKRSPLKSCYPSRFLSTTHVTVIGN